MCSLIQYFVIKLIIYNRGPTKRLFYLDVFNATEDEPRVIQREHQEIQDVIKRSEEVTELGAVNIIAFLVD